MLFGNIEPSLLDELRSRWHSERPVELEAAECCDLWNYEDEKPSFSPSLSAEPLSNMPIDSQN